MPKARSVNTISANCNNATSSFNARKPLRTGSKTNESNQVYKVYGKSQNVVKVKSSNNNVQNLSTPKVSGW